MTNYQKLAEAEAIYFDASALVKLSVPEPGSQFVIALYTGCVIPRYISHVAFGEYVGVLGQKRIQKQIHEHGFLHGVRQLKFEFESVLERIEPPDNKRLFAELSSQLISKYPTIGGGDIWHLMCLHELSKKFNPLVFICSDGTLAKASQAEGFVCIDPSSLNSTDLMAELKKVGK